MTTSSDFSSRPLPNDLRLGSQDPSGAEAPQQTRVRRDQVSGGQAEITYESRLGEYCAARGKLRADFIADEEQREGDAERVTGQNAGHPGSGALGDEILTS